MRSDSATGAGKAWKRESRAAIASILCLLFIACSSTQPSPSAPAPTAPTPRRGITSGVLTDWRLVGRADSKSRCEAMDPPTEIRTQKPAYPEDLRNKGVTGSVVLQTTISLDGVPSATQIVRTEDGRLSALAVEALRTWQFRPATCDGVPIDAYVTVTFTFVLR